MSFNLIKSNSVKQSPTTLEKELSEARSWFQWVEAAEKLEKLHGWDQWKRVSETNLYDYKMVSQRTSHLQNLRESGDIKRLVYSLQETLKRNFANIDNPDLYSRCLLGTKVLIERHLDEVEKSLMFVFNCKESYLRPIEKMQFFEASCRHFGRTAMLLSGGATFGLFHLGVVKALAWQNLLPQILSGSSAGSIVCGMLSTVRDYEIDQLFDPDNFMLDAWRWNSTAQMLRNRSLMSSDQLMHCLRSNVGELSFLEGYQRTGRIINITVSPIGQNRLPRLLNYMESPHVLIWSASLASCAVPLLFPGVQLVAKDENRREIPYMADATWDDGSIMHDLPQRRLSELYNVNHFIVSQTNPHVIPFISDHRQKKSMARNVARLVGKEVQYRCKQALEITSMMTPPGMARRVVNECYSIFDQTYYGDITIPLKPSLQRYKLLTNNPTQQDFLDFILDGERATWPKIAMVRNQTRIGTLLNSCLVKLKKEFPWPLEMYN